MESGLDWGPRCTDHACRITFESGVKPLAGISVLALPFLAAVMLFLLAALLMWLWNITIPELFRLPSLTFWQAFRLLIIAGLLFGGSSIIRIGN